MADTGYRMLDAGLTLRSEGPYPVSGIQYPALIKLFKKNRNFYTLYPGKPASILKKRGLSGRWLLTGLILIPVISNREAIPLSIAEPQISFRFNHPKNGLTS